MVLPGLQPRAAHRLVEGYLSSSPAVTFFRETPRPTNIHTDENNPPHGVDRVYLDDELLVRSNPSKQPCHPPCHLPWGWLWLVPWQAEHGSGVEEPDHPPVAREAGNRVLPLPLGAKEAPGR